MSNYFRELLKKIGSGPHTGKNLSRQEAYEATKMMLLQEATPAQIGAFMIAHRIKRPTPLELAGMLDAYEELGPKLLTENLPFSHPLVIFGNPYDGRDRTSPVTIITTLILASAGIPILLHGGESMPTKHGTPLITIWRELGVDFTHLSLTQTYNLLEKTGLGFIYLPHHFHLAQNLVPYRDQIGKRPPFATLELIWSPCSENFHLVSGFVHPPTEERFLETFSLRNITRFTTIKGLEGSCDLPLSRTAIIGLGQADFSITRLHLHPQEYGFPHHDLPLESEAKLIENIREIIIGKTNYLTPAAIYNGGFYLWRFGICSDFKTAFTQAENMIKEGNLQNKLEQIKLIINSISC
jgi:anthranilate phosphoribosyltransferase